MKSRAELIEDAMAYAKLVGSPFGILAEELASVVAQRDEAQRALKLEIAAKLSTEKHVAALKDQSAALRSRCDALEAQAGALRAAVLEHMCIGCDRDAPWLPRGVDARLEENQHLPGCRSADVRPALAPDAGRALLDERDRLREALEMARSDLRVCISPPSRNILRTLDAIDAALSSAPSSSRDAETKP